MIVVEKEPEEIKAAFWVLPILEVCIFCDTQTDTWHESSNTPVCESCAICHDESEIEAAKKLSYSKQLEFYPE